MASKGGKNANKNNASVDITKMTKEQLVVYSAKLMEEIEREREERNYFQIERDKIQTFWDITRQQLQESQVLNRVVRKETQDYEKKLEQEMLANRKKLAHMVHTYQTEAANVNVENLVSLKKFQNQFLQKKTEIITNNINNLKIEAEINLANLNQNHDLKLEYQKILEKKQDEFKQGCIDLQNKYDDKVTAYQKHFSLKHSMEMMEVEERKNEHTHNLIREHELAYQELKSFYNNILLNNLSVIENLKNKFNQLKMNEMKLMNQLKNLKNDN